MHNTDIINLRSLLKNATNTILNCGNSVGEMKKSVDCMYEIYSSVSGVTFNNQNDEELFLRSGKAISTSEAAFCLMDMKRTAFFLRGINKAIEDMHLQKGITEIKILYAGCGPYGTLSTPLLLKYKHLKLTVDLLDINQTSLNSVKRIIKTLNLNSHINNYILADAAEFKMDRKYDIIISETMQAALKNEPQVAIMQNLIPQMQEHAIFIPEKIVIGLQVSSNGVWNKKELKLEKEERVNVAEVFNISKKNISDVDIEKTFLIPDFFGNEQKIRLSTTIKVYKSYVLKEEDCTLNFPQELPSDDLRNSKFLTFRYEKTKLPRIKSLNMYTVY